MKITLRETSIEIAIGTFLLMVSGVILFALLTPGHSWGGDFAAYLHQGKALATGTLDQLHQSVTHRVNHSNSELITGPTYYPWGFPALLAVVISLFGESMLAFKALIVFFVLGSQLVVYFWLRGRVSMTVNLAISFFFGVNAFVLVFVNNILSDIPFTFFVLLTMLLATKFLLEKEEPSKLNLLAIGILMFAAFAIRAPGVVLLPTIAVLHYLGKVNSEPHWSMAGMLGGLKRIRLSDSIPYVVFLIGTWSVSVALNNPIESYSSGGHTQMLNGPALLLKGIQGNLVYYAKLPNAFFGAPKAVYVLLIIPLIGLGFIRAVSRNVDLFALLFFYMAILIIYPGRQGLRFILPMLPIILFCLFIGARYAGSWFTRLWSGPHVASRAKATATLLVVAALAVSMLLQTVENRAAAAAASIKLNAGPYEPTSQEALDYIRTNVASDKSVVFWKPRVLSYFTERDSAFAFRLEELIDGSHDYVLVQLARSEDDEWGRRIVKSTSENPQFFATVFSNDDFVLYKIQKAVSKDLH